MASSSRSGRRARRRCTPSSVTWSRTASCARGAQHPRPAHRRGWLAPAPPARSAWVWRAVGRQGRCSSMGTNRTRFDQGDDWARRHLHGRPVHLPDNRDGWRWDPYAGRRGRLSPRRVNSSSTGGLTLFDGPLHGIRHRRGPARQREDAPPPHARPRALGQSVGADGRGSARWRTPSMALIDAAGRGGQPRRGAGCRASRWRCTGTRGPQRT